MVKWGFRSKFKHPFDKNTLQKGKAVAVSGSGSQKSENRVLRKISNYRYHFFLPLSW